MDVAAFLQRIGLDRTPAGPSVEGLFALQRAYVDAVPYETVQYQFGGGAPLDPSAVAARMVAGESGGYCFQLNGVFALLLESLGYRVTMHRGGVQVGSAAAHADGTHLVLTVDGLPEDPAQVWLVDPGLDDGFYEPVPLVAGSTWQAPYELTLRRSDVVDGWRLDHDPRSSLVGMDFEDAPARLEDFAAQHARLSTSSESPFVKVCLAFRRRPESLVSLRSRALTEVFADRVERVVLDGPGEYFEVLADVFRLPLPQLGAREREQLWRRVEGQYERYLGRTLVV
ncbi:arylamine N-acetyltransferase [Kribbella sp. NPDC051770]|uniref:arylamine N-acetyltransferase family protein n=1 Tax=Kribbella sp. NPDC051770 TaxID=3155413 RepID=UPI00343C0C6C